MFFLHEKYEELCAPYTQLESDGPQKIPENLICSQFLTTLEVFDIFKLTCKLIHGNFIGPGLLELLDFWLIDWRMNAGTYGNQPDIFSLEMQRQWRKLYKIGQEMVFVEDKIISFSKHLPKICGSFAWARSY